MIWNFILFAKKWTSCLKDRRWRTRYATHSVRLLLNLFAKIPYVNSTDSKTSGGGQLLHSISLPHSSRKAGIFPCLSVMVDEVMVDTTVYQQSVIKNYWFGFFSISIPSKTCVFAIIRGYFRIHVLHFGLSCDSFWIFLWFFMNQILKCRDRSMGKESGIVSWDCGMWNSKCSTGHFESFQ